MTSSQRGGYEAFILVIMPCSSDSFTVIGPYNCDCTAMGEERGGEGDIGKFSMVFYPIPFSVSVTQTQRNLWSMARVSQTGPSHIPGYLTSVAGL